MALLRKLASLECIIIERISLSQTPPYKWIETSYVHDQVVLEQSIDLLSESAHSILRFAFNGASVIYEHIHSSNTHKKLELFNALIRSQIRWF